LIDASEMLILVNVNIAITNIAITRRTQIINSNDIGKHLFCNKILVINL